MYSSAFAAEPAVKKVVIISIESVRLIPFVEDIVTKLTPSGIKHPDNVNEEKHASFNPHSVQKYNTQRWLNVLS